MNTDERTGLEIAVIGMSGRFPGAKNLHEYWENLKNGIESVSVFSDEELIEAGIEPELLTNPYYVKARGIIENADCFDAPFFGYTPKDAQLMDPQVRIFHECVYEALEHAGYPPELYDGVIGLYAGDSMNLQGIYKYLTAASPEEQFQALLYNETSYLCTLTSYKLNLRGPSLSVQTACSTSLVAIHLACQSLLSGECDIALAGGVSIAMPQKTGYEYRPDMVYSPDGHCRAFDAKAAGTYFSDGVGVVALKSLEEAIADRDTIYAVIKGSAINNDGSARVGFTAPSITGQATVLKAAYEVAGVSPESIGYIETHGTGTNLGDPIEIEALKQAFNTDKRGFCNIGSVKTNFGHTYTAAGIASFIKVVLMLQNQMIPPNLHFETPNPKIDFDHSPFVVNTELLEWNGGRSPRRAGVSSFGIGGTNAHVVLEEVPDLTASSSGKSWQMLLLSAKTETALEKLSEKLAKYLETTPDINLADVAYTLQVGRAIFPYRRKVICSVINEGIAALSKTRDERANGYLPLSGEDSPSVIFMFAGQGSQYVNMGLGLYQHEQVFQEEIDRCFAILQPFVDYHMKEILYPDALQEKSVEAQLSQTAVAQPLIFTIEYALAKLLRQWGIHPEVMIGYSFGEYVGACLAGVLSVEDALKLIATRGKLMNRLPAGAMLSVPLVEEDVLPLLNDELSLAVVNGPSCIVAGSEKAISAFEKYMQQKRYMCMRVALSFAAHSQEMETILAEFEEHVNQVTFHEPQIPYISSSTGTWITGEQATNPKYWVQHMRDTIRFGPGIEKILTEIPNPIFVEIGPGRDLSVLISRFVQEDAQQSIINTIRNPQKSLPDRYFLLNQIAHLWGRGVKIDWNGFYAHELRHRIPLPTYPFEQHRYDGNAPIVQKVNKSLVGQADKLESENIVFQKNPDIGEWFYVPVWKPSTVPAAVSSRNKTPQQCRWLVFGDDYGLGSRLMKRLEQEGHDVIMVMAGEEFAKLNEHTYMIRPQLHDDYDAMLKALHESNKLPQKIIHLWLVMPHEQIPSRVEFAEKCQNLGFYSLIFLAQVLAEQNTDETIQIGIVSNNMHEIADENNSYPEKATIFGPCKVIPQEHPHMTCRSIDVVLPEPDTSQEVTLIEQLVAELSEQSSESVIAYRGHRRWVRGIDKTQLDETDRGVIRLRKGGVYLITGGLGAIGMQIAEYLARTTQAKLVLTRLSAFPERKKWVQWLATHDTDDEVSEKIRRVQAIENMGAEVMTASTDVTDKEQMEALMIAVRKRFGPVHGIIHAAGIPGQGLIQLKTPEAAASVLAPKVRGPLIVNEICKDMPLDFQILLSSILGLSGELGQVDYCSANAFLDAFAHYNTVRHNRTTLSINWDMWTVGFGARIKMPVTVRPWMKERLQLAISPSEGIEALDRILSHNMLPQVAVCATDLFTLFEQIKALTQSEIVAQANQFQLSGHKHMRPDLQTPYAAPRNETEEVLVHLWQETVGFDQLGILDDFFELGGDSLRALNIVQGVRKELNKEIRLRTIFDHPTVETLAAHLAESGEIVEKMMYPSVVPDTENLYEPFPLTDIQTAYLLGRSPELELGNIATHGYIEMEITLDLQRLNHAFQKAIDYHPMMRAIIMETGQQKILPEVPTYEIEVEDLSHLSPEKQQEYLQQEREKRSHMLLPAGQWPMFAWKAFKLSDTTHWLTINLDMLVMDASGLQIVVNDMMRWYAEPDLELPPLPFSFRDYVVAYKELKNSEIYDRDKAFWQQKLPDFPDAPALPLRCHPTKIKTPRFKRLQTILGAEQWTQLRQIAQKHGLTPSALLCSAYATVLSYWSNQSDLTIDLTVFNRYPFHEAVNQIVGDFTSIMMLDIHFIPGETFWQKAKKLQSTILAALEHRHYDGVEFIRDLARYKGTDSQALIPFIFTSMLFEDIEQGDKGLGLLGEIRRVITQTPQVIIDHQALLMNGRLGLTWDYVEELFDPKIIEAMYAQYVALVTDIIRGNTNPTLMGYPKIQTLLSQYNATFQAIQPTLLHQLFQQQAKATPEAIALEHGTATMSYRELEQRSNQVAWCLQHKYGVGRTDYIGVSAARSIETIVNILGILKAGGAYVPIDPEYPEDRRTYIFNNSQCKLLLLPDFYHTENLADAPTDDIVGFNTPEDVAYIIYTSGSTGRPKGVIITHQAVTNTILDINQRFSVTAKDKILGISSLCFDLSVYDIFGAFSAGATLVLIDDQRDIKHLLESLQTHRITIWNSVPAIMEQVVKMAEERTVRAPHPETSGVEKTNLSAVPTESIDPQQYRWSPVVHWVRREDSIHINGRAYTGVALQVFPDLYFFTLSGTTLDAIMERFSHVNQEALRFLVQNFIEQKVLISSILSPEEIFASQNKLFKNRYSEEIIYVPEAVEQFKKQQLLRTYPKYTKGNIPLVQREAFPEYITQRSSYRTFDARPIPFRIFSQLLSVFRQRQKADGSIRYYYASAGGLYPIDIFIYVKKNRVENVAEGLYYYNPMDNSLNVVSTTVRISREAHYFVNKEIFDSSACSLFFVYNADVTMPKYQGNGYFYACIDSGVIVGTLTQVAEHLGIGLCSIGNMNFSLIQDSFQLNRNQVLLHTVEIGLKNDLGSATLEQLFNNTDEVVALLGSEGASEIAPSLRLVMLSGDWIPLTLPERIKTNFPQSEIVSLGGATEASIWSIYYPITGINKQWTSIPYGKPLANQEFYVLNYEMQPCPVGVEGDLYIGGVGLACGYFNDEEKTRNAFIAHPVFGNLYRTGDRGIFHEEGYIEFRGRKDQQVKIRGYRIELGEIECHLLEHPAIAEALVLVRTDKQADTKYLCAYYTMKSWETGQGESIPVAELRKHLSRTLPEYMIPSHFVPLANMPLTPNGKVDVKALRAPQQAALTSTATYVAPATNTEEVIAEILKERLQLEKIGIKDNFFDLGAHSVHVIDVGNKLSEQFGKDIPLSTYFKYPTIEALARYLSPDDTAKESTDKQTARIRKAKNKFKKTARKRKTL